ncbi:MAG: PfkB family carbohydrate kinase [Burkholderiales bacterium]|jgi:pseudouridine kinase
MHPAQPAHQALPTQPDHQPTGSVLVIGACNTDIVASTHEPLRSGDSVPGHVALRPGGVARNVAHNLAALHLRTQLLSVVGDDWLGQLLLLACQQAHIDTTGVHTVAGVASASYVTVHDATGDTAAAINAMDALAHMTPTWLQRNAAQLSQASALVVDCNLAQDSLAWLCNNYAHLPIFVDGVSTTKVRRLIGLEANIHTLKINALEAGVLCAQSCETPAQAKQCAQVLHAVGCPRVLISLGAQGFTWSTADAHPDTQAYWIQPALVGATSAHNDVGTSHSTQVNTTGAGDALLSGLVYGFMHQLDTQQTLHIANACAAITLQSTHANNPQLSRAWVHTIASTQPTPAYL